jgi:hypothetical protein
MANIHYGHGSINISVNPSATPSPGGAEAEIYTFTNICPKATIQNHPDSGVNMHVLFNDAASPTASTTIYDIVLTPGDQVSSPDGIHVKRVGVHFTGAATWGTDFIVRGWE